MNAIETGTDCNRERGPRLHLTDDQDSESVSYFKTRLDKSNLSRKWICQSPNQATGSAVEILLEVVGA